MSNKIKNLFANGQKISDIVVSLCFECITLVIAFIALYGLCFSITWAIMLIKAPETLHAPVTFTGYEFCSFILSYQPVETLSFWNLSIKLQGLIAVYVGLLCFNVFYYALDWFCFVLRQFPFINAISNTNKSKWQKTMNAVSFLTDIFINVLCKVSQYVIITMSIIAIAYFVWNILVTKCPM